MPERWITSYDRECGCDCDRGEIKKWYDNVVAATSYIGPMLPP